MKKLIFAIATIAVLSNPSTLLAQTKPNTTNAYEKEMVTSLIPKNHPYRTTQGMNDAVSGTFTFKDGETMKWSLLFNNKDNKIYGMTFVKPTSMTWEVFEPAIQGMTSTEFYNGIYNCLGQSTTNSPALNNCVVALIQTAIGDCAEYRNDTHCWMLD